MPNKIETTFEKNEIKEIKKSFVTIKDLKNGVSKKRQSIEGPKTSNQRILKENLREKWPKTTNQAILKENLTCELYAFILKGIYSPYFILKIIFTIFVLVGLGLGSYTTLNLIISYLDYNVITTVRTISETPVVFPKVTFCNKNFLTTKSAHNFLLNSINIKFLDK